MSRRKRGPGEGAASLVKKTAWVRETDRRFPNWSRGGVGSPEAALCSFLLAVLFPRSAPIRGACVVRTFAQQGLDPQFSNVVLLCAAPDPFIPPTPKSIGDNLANARK